MDFSFVREGLPKRTAPEATRTPASIDLPAKRAAALGPGGVFAIPSYSEVHAHGRSTSDPTIFQASAQHKPAGVTSSRSQPQFAVSSLQGPQSSQQATNSQAAYSDRQSYQGAGTGGAPAIHSSLQAMQNQRAGPAWHAVATHPYPQSSGPGAQPQQQGKQQGTGTWQASTSQQQQQQRQQQQPQQQQQQQQQQQAVRAGAWSATAAAAAGSQQAGAQATAGPSQASSSYTSSNAIIVSKRQQGNPLLKHIRNVRWQFGDITTDYILGQSTSALFLSLRYHLLHPDYIVHRIKEQLRAWGLLLVLVHIDVEDMVKPLAEVTKAAVVNGCTLVCAWSVEECARYLETFKSYETKPASGIQERVDHDYLSRLSSTLTSIRGVNKTDAVTLGTMRGTLADLLRSTPEQLSACPGIGPTKVQRLLDAFQQPFRRDVGQVRVNIASSSGTAQPSATKESAQLHAPGKHAMPTADKAMASNPLASKEAGGKEPRQGDVIDDLCNAISSDTSDDADAGDATDGLEDEGQDELRLQATQMLAKAGEMPRDEDVGALSSDVEVEEL